ncbi:MAG: hypothetical protein QNK37_28815 [Acidobacteriota bacterium]|nr:hypothetical protein [Acidobacteriota bacterium]
MDQQQSQNDYYIIQSTQSRVKVYFPAIAYYTGQGDLFIHGYCIETSTIEGFDRAAGETGKDLPQDPDRRAELIKSHHKPHKIGRANLYDIHLVETGCSGMPFSSR